MKINEQQEQLLLELAKKSANWNDTLVFQELEAKYKEVIKKLIAQAGIEEWDIPFGIKNEWILKILKYNNECLISVITPRDDIWRNWMHNEEWKKPEENEFEESSRFVQRLSFKEWWVNYDYMWSSEFEWWAISKVLDRFLNLKNHWKLVYYTFILEKSPNVLIDKWTVVEVICDEDNFKKVKKQIIELLDKKHHLKESMYLDYIHSDSNENFLCLDNSYFFSLDGNRSNFVDYLRSFEKYSKSNKEQKNNRQINPEQQAYLSQRKYIKNNEFDKLDLSIIWNNNDIFNDILIRIQSIESIWEIELGILKQLSWNMYLSQENISRLLQVIESNYVLQKNKNSNYNIIFSNIISHINSTNKQRKIVRKYLRAIIWWSKYKEAKKELNIRRQLALIDIAEKTIEDIKQLYTLWIPFDWKWDPKEHFSWYKPYHLNINFHNNLHRLWFTSKELNVYVVPKIYKKQPNEILIWELENKWASVWGWPLNYSWIKQDYLDMEEITWVKMISSKNNLSPRGILNNHYLQRIFDWFFWKDYISWSFICDIYNIISFNENNIPTEEEFDTVKNFCYINDLEEIILEYLSQNFPWERTIEEYKETAKKSYNLLLTKIRYFDFAIEKLKTQNFSFKDIMKKAERIWYKNRDITETIEKPIDVEEITWWFFKKYSKINTEANTGIQNSKEILDESGYYTIEDLNELVPGLWDKIIVLLENDCTYWENTFDSTTPKIILMLSNLNIKPSQVLIKKHNITLEQCFIDLSDQYFFDCRFG